MQEKLRVLLRPLLFLAAFAALLAVLWKLGLFHFFMDRKRMTGFIRSLGGWGFAGFILLQAFQVVAAPIPGEATGVLGGFLYGPVVGVLLSTIGLTLGSYIAFSLSRAFGRTLNLDPRDDIRCVAAQLVAVRLADELPERRQTPLRRSAMRRRRGRRP